MKYQIGDDIIVLHSHEEGKVIDIINDKMVMIEVRGVKFPAYMDQIDFPYFYRFTKNKIIPQAKPKPAKVYIDNIPKEKPTPNKIKTNEGVSLCFIPKFSLDEFNDEVVDALKIYIVNKTNLALQFTYQQVVKEHTAFSLKATTEAFTDFYLHDIAFEEVNDSPNFVFEFSLAKADATKAAYFEAQVKLKPKQVFKQIEELKQNNLPSITHLLFKDFPARPKVESFVNTNLLAKSGFIIKQQKQKESARTVVDLHIEKLIDNWQGKSNFEILTIQLNEFEKWFDIAVVNNLTTFTVIHGIGSGKLKEEIHNLLKSKHEVNYFINQYDPRFGYGATEIFFN